MLPLLIRRSLQTLAMTGILLTLLLAILFVIMMLVTLVSAWGSDNAGVDFAFLGVSTKVAAVVLVLLFAGGGLLASRVFEWRHRA
jgi:hypothetical protein